MADDPLSAPRTDQSVIQELYDASTMLIAVLGFTYETEDLLSPDLDYASRRLIAARSAVRRRLLVTHVNAGLLERITLPSPFDKIPAAVLRHAKSPTEALS